MEIEELQYALERAQEDGHLSILLRVDDGGDFVSVARVVQAATSLLRACAISAEIARFAEQRMAGAPLDPGTSQIAEATRMIVKNKMTVPEIIDAEGIFRPYFDGALEYRRRTDGALLIDPEWLRLELIRAWHENPEWLDNLAKGASAALVSLTLIFGGINAHKQMTFQHCAAPVYEQTMSQTESLFGQTRLQGAVTPEHEQMLKDINAAHRAAIALCAPMFSKVGVEASDSGVKATVEFGSPDN